MASGAITNVINLEVRLLTEKMNSNDPKLDGTPDVTDVKEDEIPLRITQVRHACNNGSKGHQSRYR